MKKLSSEQIVMLHKLLLKHTGGADGIRDLNLLESAANSPFQSFEGQYIYPTIESRAARLGFGLIKNHPFVDGNKRVGILAMITFLQLNGVELNYTDFELVALGVGIASGEKDDKAILNWIIEHN
ncbi:MAG: type II toxin-antitoxin system death-on-curing family toxin [Clostridia bacterium]